MGADDAEDMKKRSKNAVTTLVGTDAEVSGNLTFKQGCHVAGVIKGDVIAANDKKSELTVAPSGRIDGNVQAARMLIQGKVVGDLRCSGTVTLSASARIEGSIEYGQIEIEKGAVVKGSLVMPTAGSSGRFTGTPQRQERIGYAKEARTA